jgi:hypothetical protein
MTANVVDVREPCNDDQVWFMLSFSDNRVLKVVLSDAALHHDRDGQYCNQAFRRIEDWLNFGGPPTIEYFG